MIKVPESAKEFILEKLVKYSSVASLSGKEDHFLDMLEEDFHREGDFNNWRKVFMENDPYYYYRSGGSGDVSSLPFFLVTHTDRVPNYNTKGTPAYINTITSTGEYLTGQLDNIIGIAIARYLVEIGVPIDILFTTKEEVVKSTLQLWEMCKLNKKIPITIDIDIFNAIKEFDNGLITLRFKDRNGKMLTSVVKKLHKVAEAKSIPYTFLDGEAIVETGFLSQLEDGKYKGAHVGIPLINYHSDMETTNWECIHNVVTVLHNFFNQSIKEGA